MEKYLWLQDVYYEKEEVNVLIFQLVANVEWK